MSIRVPTADRPYIARFLIEQREAKGWAQAEAIKYLVAASIGVKPGSYPSWETGARTPPEGVLERVAAFYKAEMPVDAPPPDPPKSETERLTAAISDLVVEMRLSRARQETFDVQILNLLAAVAGRPDLGVRPSDSAPEAPVDIAPATRRTR